MVQLAHVEMIPNGMVNAGMPILQEPKRVVSPFEFLPAWFFYTPVVIQSAVLSAIHRDWALPLIANPSIKLSGMVGESKHDIFASSGDKTKQWILPFITLTKTHEQLETVLEDATQQLKRSS